MTQKGLSNVYIYSVLKTKLKVRSFDGVYSADNVPDKLLKYKGKGQKSCIVNLARRREKGTHFIVLSVKADTIKIYDSLSLPLKQFSPSLYSALKKSGKVLKRAFKNAIQDIDSSFCGFYCIYFVLSLAKDQFPNGDGVVKFFKSRQPKRANDTIVIDNICAMIKNN